MIVYGLTGHIGEGKTFLANVMKDFLYYYHGWKTTIIHFATEVKNAAKVIGVTKESIIDIPETFEDFLKRANKHEFWRDFIKSYPEKAEVPFLLLHRHFDEKTKIRRFLQFIGQVGRLMDDAYWIRHLEFPPGYDCYIIDDVRFLNEADFIRNELNGKIIRIITPMNLVLKRLNVDYDTYAKWVSNDSEGEIDLIIPDIMLFNIKEIVI